VGRNVFLLGIILFLLNFGVFAQDNDNNIIISGGLGPELNWNSREGVALGALISGDCELPFSFAQLAAGLVFTFSLNFSDTIVFEPTALFRWYFLGLGYEGFFAQVDLGVHVIIEYGISVLLFEGGLRGGYRMFLFDDFYIEPYGRFGYPFAMGVGVLAGLRFKLNLNSSNSNTNTNNNVNINTNTNTNTNINTDNIFNNDFENDFYIDFDIDLDNDFDTEEYSYE